MNALKPELRRLMRWAGKAPPSPNTIPMPLGFSRRVVHSWMSKEAPDPFWIWQRVIGTSAWAAVVVILVGLALVTFQKFSTGSPYDVTPAFEVVSTDLVP